MEKRVLYKVLSSIDRDMRSASSAAPDEEYLKSLENIGIISSDWDGHYLTDLGRSILADLRNEFEKW